MSPYFLDFFKHFGIIKWINTGFTGSKIQKSWTCKALMLEMMKSGCTNLKQNKSIKLLNLLFEEYYYINEPTICIIITIFVPMVFLCFSHMFRWFSYDFPMLWGSCLVNVNVKHPGFLLGKRKRKRKRKTPNVNVQHPGLLFGKRKRKRET